MKKLFLALITGSLLVSCNNDKKENEVAKNSDWTTQNLKGRVQTLQETSYTPDSTGKIGAMDSCCIKLDKYDEKGYNNSSTQKDSKGTVKEETAITRYDAGQVKEVHVMKDGKQTFGFAIQIGKDGKYSGAQSKDSAGKTTSYFTNITEDEYGNVTGGSEYKADSSLKSTFAAGFTKGVQTSNTSKDSSGKQTFSYKAELNDKGDVIKSTVTEMPKDSTTTKVTTFKYDSYDEQGNWTQRTTYDDKGKATKVIKRTYTYYKKD